MPSPLTGRCLCGKTTYTLLAPPLITHCCHCTHCQRSTGSAFALNAVLERPNFSLTSASSLKITPRPSPSGAPHWAASCPEQDCGSVLYVCYGGDDALVYVRVGTLDGARGWRPDVHIFTESKVGWVELGAEERVFEKFYEKEGVWGRESLERLARLRGRGV